LFPKPTWEELIATARAHVVIPSLAWCARDDRSVPGPLRTYLDAALRLNGKRNDRLCRQLEQVAAKLNAIDVEPILLKGAAHLIADIYPTSAARLMSDLDLLVPQARARDAFDAMLEIGFVVDTPLSYEDHHHLPPMRHSETNIVIELHTRLLHTMSDPIVPVSWVHEQARLTPFRGTRVKIPTPTILIGHGIVHDQLNHERYARKQLELRQLVDFAVVRTRHEQEIDWAELDRRFRIVGLGHVLATYLRYDRALFHQPMPAITSAPRSQSMRRLRRTMEDPPAERRAREARQRAQQEAEQEARRQALQTQQAERQAKAEARRARQAERAARWRAHSARWTARTMTIVTLPKYYINERRRDPRGLVRVLDPRAWVRRIRLIARSLREIR
jgi:hypothetical protein